MRQQFTYTLDDGGVDRRAPLIYMWEITDTAGAVTGRYVGKASGGEKRPARHYRRRVENLLAGRPYGKGKPYRRIHRALADAVRLDRTVLLRFLCNVGADADIFEVESAYIGQYRCDADDGIGLNGRSRSEPSAAFRKALSERDSGAPDASDHDEPVDLDDFAECVKQRYGDRCRLTGRPGRYSLWLGDERVIRAKQRGSRGRVWIKLAQTSKRDKLTEFPWTGSEDDLIEAIDGQLALIAQRPSR